MRQRILAAIILCLSAATSDAALLGRAPLTPGGTDYQAYYDDVSGITWIRDANFANTSGYSAPLYPFDYGGGMYWADAQAWAFQLSVAGVDNWRLPTQAEMGHLHYVTLGHVLYSSTPSYALINESTAPFVNVGWQHYWSAESGFVFNFREGTYNSNAAPTNPNLAWAVTDGDPLAVVPIPPAVWLLSSAVGLLAWLRRRS
jgi:Protein of unknown function (DUF1566)